MDGLGYTAQEFLESLLPVLNGRVAAYLGKAPVPVTAEFVPVIRELVERLPGGRVVKSRRVLGRAFIQIRHIELLEERGWPNTLLHEMIHIYLPRVNHRRVRTVERSLVRALKKEKNEDG